MYGKFFSSTFTGSMYGAGANVFAVWGYVIANTVHSTVELNPRMLASVLGMTEAEVEAAVEYLCQPDPNSRNKDSDGKRLVKDGQFQYKVVSHVLYRQLQNEEERREYNRIKKQESRGRLGQGAKYKENIASNEMSNDGQTPSTPVTHTEAYTDTNTEAKTSTPSRALRSKGTRFPDEYQPQEDHKDLSEKLGVDLRAEFPKFRDYWKAKAGKDAIKLDWDATLRNWIRTAAERRSNGKPSPTSYPAGFFDKPEIVRLSKPRLVDAV